MKIAAIDLGTNTFHLIIAERSKHQLHILYKTNEPVRLGEDISKDNSIIPAAFARGMACLHAFKAILDTYQVDKIRAVATSGVRSADNGIQFINAVREATAIQIEVIDGDEEAELIYQGVKSSGAIHSKSLIMDIGGGSTEFIYCDQQQCYWKKSFDIGAARLMQKFFHSDPINQADQHALLTHLQTTLGELLEFGKAFGAVQLIGSAGAFETFSAMINPNLDIKTIASTPLDYDKYRLLSQRLIDSAHVERLQMPNLIPLRVDMIVMACLQINFVMDDLKIKDLSLSTYDLKMGVLQQI